MFTFFTNGGKFRLVYFSPFLSVLTVELDSSQSSFEQKPDRNIVF